MDQLLSVNMVTFLILWHVSELQEALLYLQKNRRLVKTLIQRQVFRKDGRRTASLTNDSPKFAGKIKGADSFVVVSHLNRLT